MSSRPLGRWLFGKLPVQGDFIARGLDRDLRDGIDRWLSLEMESAREGFADFEERYDLAPAWNFVDCDGAGQWSGGALCASMDRVGRRFPVVVAAPARNAQDASDVSGSCLDAIHAAFASGWDADELQNAAFDEAVLPWQPERPQWALLGEDGPAQILPGRFPEGIIKAMLEVAQ